MASTAYRKFPASLAGWFLPFPGAVTVPGTGAGLTKWTSSTNQPGVNCRVSSHTGLPAISVPVGFTPDGIPVGMEFLGRAFTEGDLLQFAYSWEQATHHRRPPATTPDIEPRWSYQVSDGVAAFDLDLLGKRFRFTAPGMDTYVYVDPAMRTRRGGAFEDDQKDDHWSPAMRTTKSIVSGDLQDDRWGIVYSIPIGAARPSTIWVNNLWTNEQYWLFGTAVSR